MSNLRSYSRNSVIFLLVFGFLCFGRFLEVKAENVLSEKAVNNGSVLAIYVFGDSTVDPGNNNYIGTNFRSNFPPYGESFVNKKPTGRFTDGRLTTDFIASYVGIKEYIPPYLDPTLSINELMTGVSFASAGSGYDPLTAQISSVMDMTKQLEYFKEYKTKMEQSVGKRVTRRLISKAVVVVSCGTNDFVVNYFTVPIRRQTYTVTSYDHFLAERVRSFVQELWRHGARNFAIAGLPPMGCLPVVITLNTYNPFAKRGCIGSYNSVAIEYNYVLQNKLATMQLSLANRGAKIFYVDIYNPTMNIIKYAKKFGFEEVSNGCCGTGLLEASFMCNSMSYVCPNVDKYVFWDSIHPTEKTYFLAFKAFQPAIDSIINS